MKIKQIEHVAINVSDIRKSRDFYGRVLGFKELQSVENGDTTITYFELPGEARLELFDLHGKVNSKARGDWDLGLRHLAFQVEDVAAHEKALREAGVIITLPTRELPHLGARVVLFLDPDGITLEFCEKL